MLALLLVASLLSLGGCSANVIMVNEQMDALISGMTATLKESNSHKVDVLNKKASFSKKVVWVTIKGSATLNGQLGDLSTMRRAGDASLSQSGSVLTLQGVFGANVGGTLKAALSWNGIKVTGSVSVSLRNFQAFVRVTHDLAAAGASPELREVRVHSIGSLSVSIRGLGVLDWALGPISSELSGIVLDVMDGWVTCQLTSALRKSVSLISLKL